MKKCNENEHLWIVIEWVKGSYHEGTFQPGMMAGGNLSYRATHFMCQKCLTKKTAGEIDLALYASQQGQHT